MIETKDLIGPLVLAVIIAILVYGLTGLAARAVFLTDNINERSNHRRPASRAGGIVITLVVTTGVLTASLFGGIAIPPFAILVLITALLGFLDDISDIPARMKMAAMILVCGGVAAMIGPLSNIPLPMGGDVSIPLPLGYLLSAMFLFGFLNAFNFMDGLNGMAGAAGVIGLCLLLVLTPAEQAGLALLYLLAASALYGFLFRNVLKGGIFLGDAGSLGIAMLLGTGGLNASLSHPDTIYILAIAFLPFLLDVVLTFIRRAARGAQLMEGHKEHYYQRLRALGWSHQAVSAGYAGLVLLSGISAVLLQAEMAGLGLWLAGGGSAGLTLLLWRIMYQKSAMPVLPQSSAPDPQASA